VGEKQKYWIFVEKTITLDFTFGRQLKMVNLKFYKTFKRKHRKDSYQYWGRVGNIGAKKH
jgi:hypothetical protein